MALVRCEECGHEISSDAEKCPNCGKDIEPFAAKLIGGLIGGLLGVAVLIIAAGTFAANYLDLSFLPPSVRSTIDSVFSIDSENTTTSPKEFIQEDFDDVWWPKLDRRSPLTDLQRSEYFDQHLRNRWVRWTGTLSNVEASRKGPRAAFRHSSRSVLDDTDVLFLPEFQSKLASFSKGSPMTYVAQIVRFGSDNISLEKGQVVDP